MTMRYLSGHLTLALDAGRCVGCGLCAKICPHGVFQIEEKRARMVARDACMECGACALNCPVEAIHVASGVGCAEAIINGILTGKETCCGEGDGCCSGNKAVDVPTKTMETCAMNDQANEAPEATNGTCESEKQETSCCASGCGCHATGTANRMRWVLGGIVLLAAAFLEARGVMKDGGSSCQKSASCFLVAPVAGGTAAMTNGVSATAGTGDSSGVLAGTEIDALADLNVVATNTDAVFVYVPAKSATTNRVPVAEIAGAVKAVQKQGAKVAVFTLKMGSRDHEQVAAQMALPVVLAMVKGRGAIPVSGEITETKLVQAFIAASSAGCCGAGGCK